MTERPDINAGESTVSARASRGDLLRLGLALGWVALPALAIAVLWAALADGLPARLATHWSGRSPDGFTGATTFSAAMLAVTGTLFVLGCVTVLVPTTARSRALWLAIIGSVAWVMAVTWLCCVVVTQNAPAPERAYLGWWLALPIIAVVPGLAAGLIAPHRGAEPRQLTQPTQPTGPTQPTEPLRVPDDVGVAWSGRCHSVLLFGVLLAPTLVILVILLTGARHDRGLLVVGLVLVAALLLGASVCSFTVTADRRGLRVISTVLRIPLRRVPLGRIESVTAALIEPGEWGGWGWRWMPGRTAVVLRRGPGIVLGLSGRRQFAVTVDDAETGAAVLESLRRRA